ncbi:MAG: hypothetical protein Q8Q90_00145 [bacterium]|nr:hypothetical protein [bacterium]
MARHTEKLARQMVNHLIKPHIDRDAMNREKTLGNNWLYLVSLLAECFRKQPREITVDLSEYIAKEISTYSTTEIILLAFVANRLTKHQRYNHDFTTKERFYAFKCTLLNLAIMHFYWVNRIYYVEDEKPWLNKNERPFLLIHQDPQNKGNLTLKFSIEGSYKIDESTSELRRHYMPHSFISLHLPKNTLHPEIAEIIKMYESGKITIERPALPLELVVS